MRRALVLGLVGLASVTFGACKFDPAYRDITEPTEPACKEGVLGCLGSALTRCENGAPQLVEECAARQLVCAPTLAKCTPCVPNAVSCDGPHVLRCSGDGQRQDKELCDTDKGYACRTGGCTQLCEDAAVKKSNVGCEYFAVDLDNAVTSQGNAALQQFAVIVSNPQPDLAARVTVEEETSQPGQPSALRVIGEASVGVRHLEIFRLGPKEVDGSPPNVPNGGTHTALTRNAFRIRSDVPIIAYQFNPLDNVNVFSNEASILLPTTALGGGGGRTYVVAGWPQTIADTTDPLTDFDINLRAFLTIVGTRPDTRVKIKTSARVVPGGPFPSGIEKGAEVEHVLQPFEVLNLETGDFNADFTGTFIDSSGPVAVFVGSEASDAPSFDELALRSCCADHLEEQVVPIRAAGKRFALGRMPVRSKVIAAAGANVAAFDEPELYRVVATKPGKTHIDTSLGQVIDLTEEGASAIISANKDFTLTASQPVIVADIQVSQEAAGVSRGLPGGDPSLTFVPPIEQWRNEYVVLTPDKYAFDFLVMTAPTGSSIYLDGLPVDGKVCEQGSMPGFVVYRCQLSFPTIDPFKTGRDAIKDGRQNDGVHRIVADYPLSILVYGFDAFVSYAYAGGEEFIDLNPN
jgi:hypothetical protein